MRIDSRFRSNNCIDSEHQQIINQEIQYLGEECVLECLMAITVFLASHSLVFQGSSEKLSMVSNGNYLALISPLDKYDEVIGKHFQHISSKQCNDHYCRKIIQNELITLKANKV